MRLDELQSTTTSSSEWTDSSSSSSSASRSSAEPPRRRSNKRRARRHNGRRPSRSSHHQNSESDWEEWSFGRPARVLVAEGNFCAQRAIQALRDNSVDGMIAYTNRFFTLNRDTGFVIQKGVLKGAIAYREVHVRTFVTGIFPEEAPGYGSLARIWLKSVDKASVNRLILRPVPEGGPGEAIAAPAAGEHNPVTRMPAELNTWMGLDWNKARSRDKLALAAAHINDSQSFLFPDAEDAAYLKHLHWFCDEFIGRPIPRPGNMCVATLDQLAMLVASPWIFHIKHVICGLPMPPRPSTSGHGTDTNSTNNNSNGGSSNGNGNNTTNTANGGGAAAGSGAAREATARRDIQAYEWVLDWFAMCLQRPDQRPRTALAFSGPQGAGKGLAVRPLQRIVGKSHSAVISDARDLTGRFTPEGQERACLLTVDESVYHGDVESLNRIKMLVSEGVRRVERKHKDAVSNVRNFLSIIFLTNSPLVARLETGDRRWAIFWVLGRFATGDTLLLTDEEKEMRRRYHATLVALGKSPIGLAAVAHFLYQRRIRAQLDRPPVTKARSDNRTRSLRDVQQWLYDLLAQPVLRKKVKVTPMRQHREAKPRAPPEQQGAAVVTVPPVSTPPPSLESKDMSMAQILTMPQCSGGSGGSGDGSDSSNDSDDSDDSDSDDEFRPGHRLVIWDTDGDPLELGVSKDKFFRAYIKSNSSGREKRFGTVAQVPFWKDVKAAFGNNDECFEERKHLLRGLRVRFIHFAPLHRCRELFEEGTGVQFEDDS